MTEGCYRVIFNGMSRKEATEFLTRQEELKSGRMEWGDEEQQRAAKSMKELNKFTTKFRGAKVEYYGRSGVCVGAPILFGQKQYIGPAKESLLKFIKEEDMGDT